MLIQDVFKVSRDKTALIYNEKSISYNELKEKVADFSAYLHQQGISKGDRVALLCQNSPEFIYAYFALASLGVAIVPLNLLFTLEEIMYIVNDSKVNGVIIHEKIFQKLKNPSNIPIPKVFVVNEEFFSKLPHSEEPPVVEESAENNLCTILYTSGTTGKPKGAMLSHKNLLANVDSIMKAIEITEKDNFLCVLPMFHSFAFTVCVLTPLYTGASITIQESFNPKETLSLVHNKRITVFAGVPAMFNFITQTADKKELDSVRIAVSGGAPLPVQILEAYESKYGMPLIEGYGLSEASPAVSFNPIHRERKKGSVGTPMPNIEVKIIDELRGELPVGEIGEIVIRGDNVMLGYLNLPAETAQTLREGWLYTGDIGYIDEDGYIFIVDRKKDLVIVGGLNVYPREIEETIYTFPGVSECAVIGKPDISRGEIVKAYIVPKEGVNIDKKALLRFLKERLAIYKLPKTVDFVTALPKTGPGKVDKKQLRKMAMEE